MKDELKQNMGNLKKSKEGKHSGSEIPSGEEIKNMNLSDLDLAATIRNQELRTKRYNKKRNAAVLLCVDGSRSQGSNERLAFAKGAVMAMLEKAYSERNRVGMIIFGDKKADLILPYTKSVDFAAEKMKNLKARGNTPLSMALRLAVNTVEQDKIKNPEDIHIVVVLTDGKSNYDIAEGRPLQLSVKAAEELKKNNTGVLIVDTENSIFGMGLARKLALSAGGKYVSI